VYQFAVYTDKPDSPYMHIIGIDIFQTSELYEFMVGDCLILIATVLTTGSSRSTSKSARESPAVLEQRSWTERLRSQSL
jgi:hypothetical protein